MSPYIERMLNGIKLNYLDPLSDEYKKLVQEWYALENVHTSTTTIQIEEYINEYTATTALLVGIILSFSSIE